VLAFSVATTAISGGTFAGFPSLIYSKGWVLALWIAGYMVVPLTAMILLGKRLNQVARVSGAVTVPDVFRDRYQSPTLGLVCTGVIFVFILANMVAQFKAGGTVLKVAMGLPSDWLVTLPLLGWRVEAGYLIGLVIFSFTVIAYTTYGGFWAVTWTDVLEGTVKIIGVILLAVLAVASVPAVSTPDGQTLTGLGAATERLRQQDPALITGPGPGQFLPLGLAFSFFLMWTLSSAGQPSGMVRLMSFRDTPSLKRALIVVCAYYAITYSCLVIIFVCARAIFPTEYLPGERPEKLGNPDDIMPAMARYPGPASVDRRSAPGRALCGGYVHGRGVSADDLVGVGPRCLPAHHQPQRHRPHYQDHQLHRDRHGRLGRDDRGAQPAAVSAISDRVHRHRAELRVSNADAADALLATGDAAGRVGWDCWRGGDGAGAVSAGVAGCLDAPGQQSGWPGHCRPGAGELRLGAGLGGRPPGADRADLCGRL
jgi:hypothetical protein